ncbi:hypothetical protein PV04_02302 [Phialophora macrospora]|uniref:JmjC domain-containing protein n=1 Tax=Phialophora macrospora TaxID=1851006 RepID=A0A0D2FTY8_9EURO|nr:hypothetical protein PV04_02302 [Phialophora macrospora]
MPPNGDGGNGRDKSLALSELLTLIQDYHDFNPDTTVPVYPYPTYLQFSQQISRGRPCVYRLDRGVLDASSRSEQVPNGTGHGCETSHHPAKSNHALFSVGDRKRAHLEEEQRSILRAPCFRWTKKTLCSLVQAEVEVAVTPDGRADSLYILPKRCPRQYDATVIGTGMMGSIRENLTEKERDTRTGPEDVANQEESEEDGDTGEPVFLQPATTRMTLSRLVDELCAPVPASPSAVQISTKKPVYYLQSQDSNLSRPELASLKAHLPATPPRFALPILGDPDATNIWIGNAQSVTSTHRDPYENLYLVVKGRKQFVLYPPVEEICLHATMVRTGRWTFDEDTKKFSIAMDVDDDDVPNWIGEEVEGEGDSRPSPTDETSTSTSLNANPNKIPWIPIDPSSPPPPSSLTYPYYKHARPLTVTVEEGQILYLPAGWFHHVTQECGQWEDEDDEDGSTPTPAPCIALNYWFDMDYSGEKHVMREMMGRLVEKVRRSERRERSEKA